MDCREWEKDMHSALHYFLICNFWDSQRIGMGLGVTGTKDESPMRGVTALSILFLSPTWND